MDIFTIDDNSIYKDGKILAIIQETENLKYSDHFNKIESGVYEWSRTLTIKNKHYENYQDLQMGIQINMPVDFYMIPGISYNGNNWGNGKEPKGTSYKGEPWKFGYHRCCIPAGMYCQNDEFAIGMWGNPENAMHFSCSLDRNEKNKFTMKLLFPEQEGPVIYCAKNRFEENPHKESSLIKAEKIELKAVIVICERDKEYDYTKFLRTAWKFLDQKSVPIRDKKEIWNLGFNFIQDYAYFKEDDFSGFCMGLSWNGKQWIQKKDYLEIGWVGQNASLAVSLIYKYVIEGDSSALHMGLGILDNWIENAALPNGMFRCRFDKIQMYHENLNNRDEKNDAANLFSVVDEYLDAYQILKDIGIKRENYKEAALKLCYFMLGIQQDEGKFGKAWYNDGICSDSEGTIGCYIGKALSRAYQLTKDENFLFSIKACFLYYYEDFIMNGYTTAGALDTYCVDKESAIPLLGISLDLFQYTRQEHYLKKAEVISNYLATWQYHYNVDFSKDTLLGKMNYKTRGGTAVSVQHHHIDCYGLAFYEDWILLSQLTGDDIWKERAEAMWNNSLYNISDGDLIINGQKRPRGSQDEGFLQTRWHTKKGEYFGISEWLVVWNTAFRLKVLRKEYLLNTSK